MESIEKAIVRLILNNKERFYGNFLLNSRRIYTKSIPTAGVSITEQVNLYINPDFFDSLSLEEQTDVLKHEAQHLINFHPLRFDKASDNKNEHSLFNIAADAEINPPLKSLHKMGVTVKKIQEMLPDEKIKDNMLAEYYFEKLKKAKNKMQDKFEEMLKNGDIKLVDDHSKWSESTKNDSLAKSILTSAMKGAVEKTGGIGNCPNEVALALDKLCKSTINWKQQLRQFFARVHKYNKTITRKKRNRRYGVLVAGKKKKPQVHVAIGIDESGSVSQQEWEQFYGEIAKIHKSGDVKMTIVTCDTEVGQVFDYDPKKPIKRTRSGGTMYQPVIDKASELNVDALIFFNDRGHFDNGLKKPNYPVLWATVGRDSMLEVENFGKEIKVAISNEKV